MQVSRAREERSKQETKMQFEKEKKTGLYAGSVTEHFNITVHNRRPIACSAPSRSNTAVTTTSQTQPTPLPRLIPE